MADLSIIYRISADITGLQKGLNRAATATEKLESNATRLGKTLLGAFSATAILAGIQQAVSATLKYADALSNLNARTGVSVQGLQRMESIGASAGVSMEALAKSVTMLQRNLDNPKALDALAQMGLSYSQIRAMKPEDQFIAIAKGLAQIDDPIERANAGTALFGKNFAEVAGAFEGDVDAIVAAAVTMSDEQVAALDRAGDAWDQWYLNTSRRLKGFAGEVVGAAQIIQQNQKWYDQFLGPLGQVMQLNRAGVDPTLPPAPKAPTLPQGAGAEMLPVDVGKTIADMEAARKAEVAAEQAANTLKIALVKQEADARREAWKERAAMLDFLGLREMEAAAESFQVHEEAITAERNLRNDLGVLNMNAIAAEMAAEEDYATMRRAMLNEIGVANMNATAERMKKAEEEKQAWKGHLSEMAAAFTQLSQVANGALSSVTQGIGTMFSAISGSISAVTTLKSGFSSLGSGSTLNGIMSITSGIAGIVGMAQTAISVVKSLWSWATGGEEGNVVNPARDAWFNTHGGTVGSLGDKLAPFMDGEAARQMIERVFGAKTKGDFEAATGAIDTVLNAPRLAAGGLVRQPTLAMIGEAGPELVTPLSRLGPSFGGAMNPTGATVQPPVVVNLSIAIDGVFSEGDLVQTVQRRVAPILAQTIEDNVAGSRTRFQDVLGVP